MPSHLWNSDRAVGRRESRPSKIKRVARKLADRAHRQGKLRMRPFRRRYRKPKQREIIAYDLETTRIKAGTPAPLYITAYGESFRFSGRIQSITDLRNYLIERFLVPENAGKRFVAWNGNNFDVFFVGAALLYAYREDSIAAAARTSGAALKARYVLRPYLTRNKALRGLKVSETVDGVTLEWEFLDGFAMAIGSPPTKLAKFLKTFAPEYMKLEGPDFEQEDFSADNLEHVKYAERDSEGLYHALQRVESILWDKFEQCLQPTVGNLGIRIFQANLPESKEIWSPGYALNHILRKHVMRGGYCFCARKFVGPVWKYDINQAYAAAMREADLPAGRSVATKVVNPYAACAIYRVRARNRNNRVPFYVRDSEGKQVFALTEFDAWITSIELEQLKAEHWSVAIDEGYFWEDRFNMRDMVDRLEGLRMSDPDGPSGALGTVCKAIGNNSYGKTVEELDGLELVMSMERPNDDFFMYQDETDTIRHIWARIGEPQTRDYHQPQVGCFITAHVRMVLRQAILLAPESWLYSDTDCCFFDRPVGLPIDPKIYGRWKIEAEGERYRLIAKKVYAKIDGSEKKAKGLNIKRLTAEDFEKWFNGEPPEQRQIQRQNFLAVMTGAEMFVERVKVGQRL